jgi:hypothetical protein
VAGGESDPIAVKDGEKVLIVESWVHNSIQIATFGAQSSGRLHPGL